MEKVIQSPATLQTLNPRACSHPRSLPPPRRRSHLDSASYRTLVRIFSLCLDESLNTTHEPPVDPNPVLGAAAPEAPESLLAGKDSIFDRNDDGIVAEEPEPRADPTPVLGAAAPEVPESSLAGKDSIFDRNDYGIVAEELGRGGSESIECGNPRFDAASEVKLGLEEKFGYRDDGNGSLVSVGLQPQFGDGKDEALQTTEDPGHQREVSGKCADGGFHEGPVIESKSLTFQQENVCLGEALKTLSDMIFDFSELIEVQDNVLGSVGGSLGEVADGVSEKGLFQIPASKDQVADLVSESEQRSKHEPEDECVNGRSSEVLTAEFNALSVSQSRMCSSPNELLHDITNEGHSDHIYPSATDLSRNKLMTFKPQEEMSNSRNESVEKHQQKLLDSSMKSFVSKQLDKNLVNALVELDNDEEVEEGQIPGDFWNLDESGAMVHENALLEDQKLDIGSGYSDFLEKGGPDCLVKLSKIDCSSEKDIKLKEDNPFVAVDERVGNGRCSLDDRRSSAEMKKSCSYAPEMDVEHQAVAVNAFGLQEENSTCQNKASIVEAVKIRMKKKRGALTEERKAKKKKAKKRKRAEKEREQGVKRLKLQPVVKPKAVKLCNFYLMGRCQQGDLCKFSHDATPLTKSQPCKYFACDSCLKGDDCPFDHQLSKYPCHNFQSKGMCHRGDRCKFSHKIPTIEGSPSTSIASNLVSPLTSEKLNVGKQKSMIKKLANASVAPKTTTSSTPFVSPKLLEGNSVKTAKEPMRIPNGIRFISFGNGPSESMKMSVDGLASEKHGCSQQKPEKSLADGHKNTVFLSEKSFPKPQRESSVSLTATNTFGGSYFKNKNSSSGPATTPVSRKLQREVSDASKILEEFLFGATG